MTIDNIVIPIRFNVLHQYLVKTKYDIDETTFLVSEFKKCFNIRYQGPVERRDESNNIPFTVGNRSDMLQKIMKEVQAGRFVGPFEKNSIPYEYYVQSPIGLVPKSGGRTRLIFHLSYKFRNGNPSINECQKNSVLCSTTI